MSNLNLQDLSLDSLVEFRYKGQLKRSKVVDMVPEGVDPEDFLNTVAAWIQTGHAVIIDQRSKEDIMADKIASELGAIKYAQDIRQDHEDRLSYRQDDLGFHKKVGFPAKSIIHAQEIINFINQNYNIDPDTVGMEVKGKNVQVIITECPVKVYQSLSKNLAVQRATEYVTSTVEKTAKTAMNGVDLAIGSVGVPVAKTAIKTTTKVAKSVLGFGAKICGIAIGETIKATRELAEDITTDIHLAEARGEVIDGMHTIKRTVSQSRAGKSFGGVIIEE